MLGESRGMPPGKFLISKNQHCETADNVDGHGNVKMQLEHRSKKSQREARRQSWSGDNQEKQNSMQARPQGKGESSVSTDFSDWGFLYLLEVKVGGTEKNRGYTLRRKGFTSNRGIGALISIDLLLSSMDSDADETFFDAQDHAALYGKNELSSLKQKRPCSLGDVDMTGDSESDITDWLKSVYLESILVDPVNRAELWRHFFWEDGYLSW
ncbi:hypothetical protein GQR58_027038 [Nymphon striatum]|nr:hypothetical protein GQR58_027038 [Nymphon striatum]